ncbi:MAG: NAD(P)/FAD-dependent oxidoreductase [Planctomycetaceae bacterium]
MSEIPSWPSSAALPSATWDVVVIGAGLAGSLTALLASRAGARVLLVEKKALPRDKVCGGCLNTAALRVFERAGLLPGLAALGGPWLERYELFAGGPPLRIPLAGGVSVSRSRLDAWLVTQARQAAVHCLDQVQALVVDLPDPQSPTRVVELSRAGQPLEQLETRLVVVADGLAHASLQKQPGFVDRISPRSHVGLAARAALPSAATSPERGTIAMAVGDGGYVGLARDETGDVHLAAAVDPRCLRSAGGPAACVAAILGQAGHPLQGACAGLSWIGTGPLTHHLHPAAAHRLFVVGDALRYVEPFTGEGMAWALHGAERLAPLLLRALAGWRPGFIPEWNQPPRFGRGAWCRTLTTALRSHWLVRPVVAGLRHTPRLARYLAAAIDPPSDFSRERYEAAGRPADGHLLPVATRPVSSEEAV